MADELTDGELHELIAAAKATRDPAPASLGGAAMSYDFKRPQKVDKDQTRRLESIHEQFARLAGATLSSNLRMVVDVDVAFCDQLLYNEFTLSLPSPCSAYSFVIEPHGGRAVMSLAPELLGAVVDRAFGGQGRGLVGDESRSLTEIELRVVNKVVERLVADFEATWEHLSTIQVADTTYETNPEFIQIATPGEGALVIALEANSKYAGGLIHICYPLSTLDPLLQKLAPSAQQARRAAPAREQDINSHALRNIRIPVHVQAARGSLSLDDVAGLKVGDVIKLDTRADEAAVVFVGDRPKYLGRIGLQGRNRAVEVTGRIFENDEDRYR